MNDSNNRIEGIYLITETRGQEGTSFILNVIRNLKAVSRTAVDEVLHMVRISEGFDNVVHRLPCPAKADMRVLRILRFVHIFLRPPRAPER